MRRHAFPILFLLVLVAPFAVRAVVGTGPRDSITGQADRLVVVTPNSGDVTREFAAAFDAWHRRTYNAPVRLDYRIPGGTTDIKRMLATLYRSKMRDGRLPPESDVDTGLDVVWGGGDFFFDQELKPLGVLAELAIPPQTLAEAFPSPTLAGVKLYDANPNARPRWVGACLSSFGIVYNPDLYATLALDHPTTWRDLTDEKLAGLVALADPSHSGSAATAYMIVIQRAMADEEDQLLAARPDLKSLDKPKYTATPDYRAALSRGFDEGMRQLLRIAANARYFTDSGPTVPNDVGNAEAAAGMAIDFYGRVYQESVGPARCRFVQPRAATAVTPDPVGILYGTKGRQRQLADHFVEFLLTKEAQRLWALKAGAPAGPRDRALRRMPARRDVYADRTNWSDDVNPFEEAGNFNLRGEWMTLFTDLRPLWAAAWIDSRDALKDAYSAVRKVPDASNRARLLDTLSHLPITMADVESIRSERRRRESTGDAEEWKARSRLDWARRFRQHYATVESEAHRR